MFKKDDIVVLGDLEVKVYHMVDRDNFSGVVIKDGGCHDIGYQSDSWDVKSFRLKYRPTDSTDLLLEIKKELEVIKEKLNKAISKPERWRADIGDYYYYIDGDFEVSYYNEDRTDIDKHLYSIGNYFQNTEEAEKYADRMKQLLLNREL